MDLVIEVTGLGEMEIGDLVAAVPLSQIRVRYCRKECFHLLHLHSGVSAAQD